MRNADTDSFCAGMLNIPIYQPFEFKVEVRSAHSAIQMIEKAPGQSSKKKCSWGRPASQYPNKEIALLAEMDK
jgi:hypothetical protein